MPSWNLEPHESSVNGHCPVALVLTSGLKWLSDRRAPLGEVAGWVTGIGGSRGEELGLSG